MKNKNLRYLCLFLLVVLGACSPNHASDRDGHEGKRFYKYQTTPPPKPQVKPSPQDKWRRVCQKMKACQKRAL